MVYSNIIVKKLPKKLFMDLTKATLKKKGACSKTSFKSAYIIPYLFLPNFFFLKIHKKVLCYFSRNPSTNWEFQGPRNSYITLIGAGNTESKYKNPLFSMLGNYSEKLKKYKI